MTGLELGWGLDLVLWFQSWRTPLVETLGVALAFLGSETLYMLVMPLIYWCIDAGLGRRISFFVLMTLWLNSAVKLALKRPRPYMVSMEVVVPEGGVDIGYGLPSGHAQTAVTLWGAVAVELKHRWLTLAVIVYALLISLSRLVIGVHYLQDVVAGLLIGGVLLALYAWLEHPLGRWFPNQPLAFQIGLIVLMAIGILVIHPGLIPVSTPPNLPRSFSLDDLMSPSVTPIAVILGAGIGFILEFRYLRFDASGDAWKRLLRFILGMAGLVVLRFGLGALFDDQQPLLVFRLIRYSVIGFWIGYLAPWLFIKLNLARSLIPDQAHAEK
jgi:membrane-associated phospholipid phosphatase